MRTCASCPKCGHEFETDVLLRPSPSYDLDPPPTHRLQIGFACLVAAMFLFFVFAVNSNRTAGAERTEAVVR